MILKWSSDPAPAGQSTPTLASEISQVLYRTDSLPSELPEIQVLPWLTRAQKIPPLARLLAYATFRQVGSWTTGMSAVTQWQRWPYWFQRQPDWEFLFEQIRLLPSAGAMPGLVRRARLAAALADRLWPQTGTSAAAYWFGLCMPATAATAEMSCSLPHDWQAVLPNSPRLQALVDCCDCCLANEELWQVASPHFQTLTVPDYCKQLFSRSVLAPISDIEWRALIYSIRQAEYSYSADTIDSYQQSLGNKRDSAWEWADWQTWQQQWELTYWRQRTRLAEAISQFQIEIMDEQSLTRDWRPAFVKLLRLALPIVAIWSATKDSNTSHEVGGWGWGWSMIGIKQHTETAQTEPLFGSATFQGTLASFENQHLTGTAFYRDYLYDETETLLLAIYSLSPFYWPAALDRKRLLRWFDQGQQRNRSTNNQSATFSQTASALTLPSIASERVRFQAAIAELAAGAGHEINNPLATISGITQRLLPDEDRPAIRQAYHRILEQTQRIHRMIRDLRLVGRPEPTSTWGWHLLDDIVEHALRASARRALPGSISWQPVGEPWQVVGYRDLLIRLVEEIVTNASQAAGPMGWVRLCWTEPEPIESSSVDAVGDLPPRSKFIDFSALPPLHRSDNVQRPLLVIDSGMGFRAEDLEFAGTPFYSGRPAGRGLGMGLWVARRLLELHQGHLRLRSGQPTTVEIWLRCRAGDL